MAFYSESITELGDIVQLAPGSRSATSFDTVLTSWVCGNHHDYRSTQCLTTQETASFEHDITLTFYEWDVATESRGSIIGTPITQTFDIPYRPSASTDCTGHMQFKEDGQCRDNLRVSISFEFDAPIELPRNVVWTIAFASTGNGHPDLRIDPMPADADCNVPTGGDENRLWCGYDGLNLGLGFTDAPPAVGVDLPRGVVARVGGTAYDAVWYPWEVRPIGRINTTVADEAASTVVLRPGAQHGWAFSTDDSTSTGQTGTFVEGPATPPLGTGSAELAVTGDPAQGSALSSVAYGGTPLADLTELTYSSSQPAGVTAISLSFSIRYDGHAGGWQGRLVYEPYQTSGTVPGGWNEWNTIDPLVGKWWASNAAGAPCLQSSPCTWSEILEGFPDAVINPGDAQVAFKAGTGWSEAFAGNVDALTVGVLDPAAGKITSTTYDFEGPADPTCLTTDSTEITDVSEFDTAVIRSSGHFEIVEGAAHLWTDDDSTNAKVAGFVDVSGTRIGEVFDIDWDGTNPGPGAWILLSDGSILIGESVYGNTFWTDETDPAAGYAPQVGGGNGSPFFGTPAGWQAAIEAQGVTVVGVGFSLGSGVKGDGILTSVTVGCHTITFDLPEEVLPPVEPVHPDFNPVTPVRLFDTRPGTPATLLTVPQAKLAPGHTLRVKVTDLAGGIVPATDIVDAVSLNVTATQTTSSGYITVQPCGSTNVVSSVNFQAGKDRANAVIVPVSADGEICFSSDQTIDVLADLNGWFRADQGYVPVTPSRVFDTRPGAADGLRPVTKQLLAPGQELEVKMTGLPGDLIPADGVTSVSLNVTAAGGTADGFVSVTPCGPRHEVSSVNFKAGADTANAVIVPVSADGSVCFSSSVPTYLVVDVNSWFKAGSDLQPVTPDRVFDTRPGTPATLRTVEQTKLVPGKRIEVKFTDLPGGIVPVDGVYAVSLNVTTAGAAEAGYVTVTPCGPLGEVSSVNFQAGTDTANAVLTGVSATGTVCFYASTPVDVLVDISGWFQEPVQPV